MKKEKTGLKIDKTNQKLKVKEGEGGGDRLRKLGTEWASWDGAVSAEVDTPKHTFLFFAFIAVLIFIGISYTVYYLIKPRLDELGQYISLIFFIGFIVVALYLLTNYLMLLLTSYTKTNISSRWKVNFKVLSYILDKVFAIGKLFNYNKDRLGNSFVKVTNKLYLQGHKNRGQSKRLLILLPRCLTKDNYENIKRISKEHNVELAICGGGEIARKKVKEYRPSEIIGVACERDLVSGIKDVGAKLPVYGIPNIRPNGPCQDTYINLEELEDIVKLSLKGQKT